MISEIKSTKGSNMELNSPPLITGKPNKFKDGRLSIKTQKSGYCSIKNTNNTKPPINPSNRKFIKAVSQLAADNESQQQTSEKGKLKKSQSNQK